jgi:hypothetical protein
MDIAIAGMNSLTSANFTAGALTIANTLGDSSATNIAAGSAQYATIKVSSLAVNSTITAPSSNRSYRIINADATYSLTIKASGQTGVTFLPGQTGVVAFNGTDYVIVGVVGAGTATDNAVARFDGTTGEILQSSGVTIDDSNNVSGVAQLNITTLDATNIEVTNIKAKDGTAAGSIADSTGVVTLASSVLTTTDINGGTIDGTTIGGSTAAAGSFTTLTTSSTVTLNGGTANGVLYLDGSKVATSGSALTFNGTELGTTSTGLNINNANALVRFQNGSGTRTGYIQVRADAFEVWSDQAAVPMVFGVANSEAMRLTSTGLGIGTSSPGAKLELYTAGTVNLRLNGSLAGGNTVDFYNYIPAVSNNGFSIAIGGTNRLSIDSSGNLGLGVTPSAWNASFKALQVSNTVIYNNGSADSFFGSNYYKDTGGTNKYITSAHAATYGQVNGAHQWFTAASGTAGNAITFTQAMTLDASGNLGVGTSSPGAKLDLAAGTGASVTAVLVRSAAANANGFQIVTDSTTDNVYLNNYYNAALRFGTNNTERARITSGGSFCVHDGTVVDLALVTFAKTTETSPVLVIKNPQYSCDMWSTNTSGDNVWARFFSETSATQRGSISYNRTGGLVAYNTTSDYRAKDILGSVTDSGAIIDALKVYEGKMKGATQSRPMLVAHEAQALAPYAVTGEKDAVDDDGNPKYQQMDVSSFVPLLIAEIQSLRQRVAQLEGTQP